MAVELDEQGRAVRPRAHADAAFLAAKRARIDEAHVAPLNALVRVWRQPANVTDPFAAPVEPIVSTMLTTTDRGELEVVAMGAVSERSVLVRVRRPSHEVYVGFLGSLRSKGKLV